jgi:hypothetical protein
MLCKLRPVGGNWLIESHLVAFDEKVDQHSHEWLACREYPEERILFATECMIQYDFATAKNAYLRRCLLSADAFKGARQRRFIDIRSARLVPNATHLHSP